MRHATLTSSPCCARKAAKHHKTRKPSKAQRARWRSCKFTRLTIKEAVEVGVIVKVNARVRTAGAVVFGRKSSLNGEINTHSGHVLVCHVLWTDSREMTLTLTKLVIQALRYLTAICTTTSSSDRVSCLNKVPNVIRVDDFKN